MRKRDGCYCCGSLPTETAFPVEPPKRLPPLCLDCLLEWASFVSLPQRLAETRLALRRRGIVTRASARASARYRQRQPQRDLVDWLARHV